MLSNDDRIMEVEDSKIVEDLSNTKQHGSMKKQLQPVSRRHIQMHSIDYTSPAFADKQVLQNRLVNNLSHDIKNKP
jgi:hypothetical protein